MSFCFTNLGNSALATALGPFNTSFPYKMTTPITYIANHTSDHSEPQSTLAHSRNLSTISSTTLHTNTTLLSQPLLRPISAGSGESYDVVSQQSRISDRIFALPRWLQTNVNTRSPSIVDEKREFMVRKPWRRGKVLCWSKNILLTIRGEFVWLRRIRL